MTSEESDLVSIIGSLPFLSSAYGVSLECDLQPLSITCKGDLLMVKGLY